MCCSTACCETRNSCAPAPRGHLTSGLARVARAQLSRANLSRRPRRGHRVSLTAAACRGLCHTALARHSPFRRHPQPMWCACLRAGARRASSTAPVRRAELARRSPLRRRCRRRHALTSRRARYNDTRVLPPHRSRVTRSARGRGGGLRLISHPGRCRRAGNTAVVRRCVRRATSRGDVTIVACTTLRAANGRQASCGASRGSAVNKSHIAQACSSLRDDARRTQAVAQCSAHSLGVSCSAVCTLHRACVYMQYTLSAALKS